MEAVFKPVKVSAVEVRIVRLPDGGNGAVICRTSIVSNKDAVFVSVV
jgi:hypothetical protein